MFHGHTITNHIGQEAGNIQMDKYNNMTMKNTKMTALYFHDFKFGH